MTTKLHADGQKNVAVQDGGAANAVKVFPDDNSRLCLGCHDGLVALSCQCKAECISQYQQAK